MKQEHITKINDMLDKVILKVDSESLSLSRLEDLEHKLCRLYNRVTDTDTKNRVSEVSDLVKGKQVSYSIEDLEDML